MTTMPLPQLTCDSNEKCGGDVEYGALFRIQRTRYIRPSKHLGIDFAVQRTFPKMDGVNPFIRMPRMMCLEIIEECDLNKNINSLSACENLRRIGLRRGDSKRVITDYGKPVTYACVGPQVSRNFQTVLSHRPYMDALPDAHWRSLVWMMKCAERSFRMIADHSVVSHLHHAKRVVPFKRFTSSRADCPEQLRCRQVYFQNVF
jgi:hypothetical protein